MQGELERALAIVLRRPDGVPLTVAGRTDAGVHALGQVASYAGPVAPPSALNALLPDDVAVLSCSEASDGFDARRDATSRAYLYRVLVGGERSAVWRGRALVWRRRVDVEMLSGCAAALVGNRDFTAFTPSDTYHVRFERNVLSAGWRSTAIESVAGGRLLEFTIEADAFMRHMNRVLVGTMLEVASGAWGSVADFERLLGGAPRSAAGRTAPAHGLYLVGVGYAGEQVLGRGIEACQGDCRAATPRFDS